MKKEHDFSKAERGKFHRPDAKLRIPIYLESEIEDFVAKTAEAKSLDTTTVVNELLRSDMHLAEVIR